MSDARPVWRLLEHGPVDGRLNMALDRAIQIARERGSAPPTLRLYRWSRPTVTLGRFQDASEADPAAIAAHGLDVARRFTGGRGVIHDAEVTYAAVAGEQDGVPRGVAASYRLLCTALVAAYENLGVDASLTRHDRGVAKSPACYLHTTRADLSIGPRKLSGSAQVWLGETVLQHGSFTLHRDPAREAEVFSLDAGHAARLADASRGLDELLGSAPSTDAVSSAIVDGFERALGITLVPGELSAEEAETAGRIRAEGETSP